MVSVIRDIEDDNDSSSRSIWIWLVAIILGTLIIASGVMAALNAASLGLSLIHI